MTWSAMLKSSPTSVDFGEETRFFKSDASTGQAKKHKWNYLVPFSSMKKGCLSEAAHLTLVDLGAA